MVVITTRRERSACAHHRARFGELPPKIRERVDVSFGLSRLKPKGTFIDINPTLRRMFRGMWSRRYKLAFATMATKRLADIGELAAQGKLEPTIGLEATFSDALATIAAVERGQRPPGRVVIDFSA